MAATVPPVAAPLTPLTPRPPPAAEVKKAPAPPRFLTTGFLAAGGERAGGAGGGEAGEKVCWFAGFWLKVSPKASGVETSVLSPESSALPLARAPPLRAPTPRDEEAERTLADADESKRTRESRSNTNTATSTRGAAPPTAGPLKARKRPACRPSRDRKEKKAGYQP